MKKYILITAAMMLSVMLSAQTQQGFVKTKGRMVNGQLVPGQGIKGATVSVQGRTPVLVNADDGAFSFLSPNPQFRLDSVRKKGYQLVDLEACPKNYVLSSNPLYLIMETPEQQLQDKLNAERKIRRNLQKQLQAKEDELEALKAENKLSMEEYQQSLQQLYDEQESNEHLISDMAKRYSELDYDQLDDFYRQVSYCIENGELVKADSLLNTRGNISKQVEEQLEKGQALQEREELLSQAKAVHTADNEELAKRCYSYYEAFAAQHLNDTAAYYLELRSSLDTTRAEWLEDAGFFISEYLADYDKAIGYFTQALNNRLSTQGEDNPDVANCYSGIGLIYYYQGKYAEALENHGRALDIYKKVAGEDHPEVATSYSNMGIVYFELGEYDKSMECYDKALIIRKKVFGEEHPEVATVYNNMGNTYIDIGDLENALKCHNRSLEISKKVLGENHPNVALSYNNLGMIYHFQGNFSKAMEYYNRALEIYKTVFGEEHPIVALTYNNMGGVYDDQGDRDKALEYYSIAFEKRKRIYGEKHPIMASSFSNIGSVYSVQGEYAKAIEYYNNSLDILVNTFGEEHPDVANVYNNIGAVYYQQHDDTNAMEYFSKALKIRKLFFDDEHPDVAVSYNNIGNIYKEQGDLVKALECYNKTLASWEKMLNSDHPYMVMIREKIAEVEAKMKEKD